MNKVRPFEGLKVVELATYVATPSCAMLLSDWGADVVKVESGKGDTWRYYPNTVGLPCKEDDNPLFDVFNGGKRGICMDLKKPEGLKAFKKLLETADIFITSWRQKALERSGIDYASIKDDYPKLIYAHLTGYGDVGPNKDEPGYDNVAFWAKTGFLADQGITSDGSYPILPPGGMGDIITGNMLFGGVCAALYTREKTGRGDRVSISLYGAGIYCMSMMTMVTQKKYRGMPYPRTRWQCMPNYAPFKTADQEWIQLSVADWEKKYRKLFELLGRPDLAEVPEYQTLAGLRRNTRAIMEEMNPLFQTKTAEEWQKLLTEADMAHDRLGHYYENELSEQAKANGYIVQHETRSGEVSNVVRPAIRMDSMGEIPLTCGPVIGEHSVEILKDAGYGEDEIRELLETGAVWQHESIVGKG